MNVSVGEELEAFVKERISHGDYQTKSDVVRDALRRLKDLNREPAALQDAMDEAEASGFKRFEAGDWEKLRGLALLGKRRR